MPVVNAGPFYETSAPSGTATTWACTAGSRSPRCLDRDAEELFERHGAGLAFFGERFAMPFPQRRYDQVFVPDMGGAMENYGCVTWGDACVYRSEPDPRPSASSARRSCCTRWRTCGSATW